MAGEIAQGLVEFFLARHLFGDVELAADFVIGIEQSDLVAALGRRGGKGEASRSGPDHGQRFGRWRGRNDDLGFMAGARVHQT